MLLFIHPTQRLSDFLSWTKYSSGSKVSYAPTRFNSTKKQMQNCFCDRCWEHKSRLQDSVFNISSNLLGLMMCHWVHLHTFFKRNTSLNAFHFTAPSLCWGLSEEWESKINKMVFVPGECTVYRIRWPGKQTIPIPMFRNSCTNGSPCFKYTSKCYSYWWDIWKD